jgi:Cytochrome c oxidase subunit VIa
MSQYFIYPKRVIKDSAVFILVFQPASFFIHWLNFASYVYVVVIVATAWVWGVEVEHMKHEEHLKAENGGRLPEPPAHDFLNMRNKPFPWGPNSLFFNPAVRDYHTIFVFSS